MTWERAKEATRDGREGVGRAAEVLIGKVQSATGLRLRETLGWGENVLGKAEGKAADNLKVTQAAVEVKDTLDKKVGQSKDDVVHKVDDVKRLV